MSAARERTASLVRLGWGPEQFRAAAAELRASCTSSRVGWGLDVARHELAREYEAEAARLEGVRVVVDARATGHGATLAEAFGAALERGRCA